MMKTQTTEQKIMARRDEAARITTIEQCKVFLKSIALDFNNTRIFNLAIKTVREISGFDWKLATSESQRERMAARLAEQKQTGKPFHLCRAESPARNEVKLIAANAGAGKIFKTWGLFANGQRLATIHPQAAPESERAFAEKLAESFNRYQPEPPRMIQILSVRIEKKIDDDADTSWLGKESDDEKDFSIVREGEHAGKFATDFPGEDFPRTPHEHRFFNAGTIEDFNPNATWLADIAPEKRLAHWRDKMRKNAQSDFARWRDYRTEKFYFVGIIAKADISINGTAQVIRSGGLWGIESDSGAEYFASVESEQLNELAAQLKTIGFTARNIKRAFAKITR